MNTPDIFRTSTYLAPKRESYTLSDNINRAMQIREKTPKARHRFEKTSSTPTWDLSIKDTAKRTVSPLAMRVSRPSIQYRASSGLPIATTVQNKVAESAIQSQLALNIGKHVFSNFSDGLYKQFSEHYEQLVIIRNELLQKIRAQRSAL